MTLEQRLNDDVKQAMRDKNEVARDTLRMVLASLKNRVVELRTERGSDAGETALTDDDVLAVLAKAVKSRKESVVEYEKAGREELAAKERAEIAVIEGYLPKQLDADETRNIVSGLIDELGISSKKDIGQLMKAVMAKHKGTIDGKLVQQVASELLS